MCAHLIEGLVDVELGVGGEGAFGLLKRTRLCRAVCSCPERTVCSWIYATVLAVPSASARVSYQQLGPLEGRSGPVHLYVYGEVIAQRCFQLGYAV